MKHEAPGHPKMRDLATRLNIPLYAAGGIMEFIWHYAGDYTPRGDIGRLTNAVIAKAIDWQGSPEDLVQALVDSHWLDRDEQHRLIVHDWPAHAQEWVRKKLNRSKQNFLECYDRTVPIETVSRQCSDAVANLRFGSVNGSVKENSLKDSDGFELETPETQPRASLGSLQRRWFDEDFWPKYWRKVDKAEALKSFTKHATSEAVKTTIVAAVEAQAPMYLSRDPEHRPHASTWLNKRRYEDPEPALTPPQQKPQVAEGDNW